MDKKTGVQNLQSLYTFFMDDKDVLHAVLTIHPFEMRAFGKKPGKFGDQVIRPSLQAIIGDIVNEVLARTHEDVENFWVSDKSVQKELAVAGLIFPGCEALRGKHLSRLR